MNMTPDTTPSLPTDSSTQAAPPPAAPAPPSPPAAPQLLGNDPNKPVVPQEGAGVAPGGAQNVTDSNSMPLNGDFKLPEDFEVDKDTLGKFTELGKKYGLNQGQAQALIDMQADFMKNYSQQTEAKMAGEIASTISQWETQSKFDPEYGGANFDANIGLARSAIQQFGSPELLEYLSESGIGNHPEVIRFCYRIGKQLSPDAGTGGMSGTSPATPTDVASSIYTTMRRN